MASITEMRLSRQRLPPRLRAHPAADPCGRRTPCDMSQAAAILPAPRIALGLALGVAGVVIFGATLPATRLAVADLDPWFVTFGRAAAAGLLAAVQAEYELQLSE